MSPSCEEKPLWRVGGKTASPGAAETGNQELDGRDELPTVLLLLLLFPAMQQAHTSELTHCLTTNS